MTPGDFVYHRPGSVEDALGLLADFGDEGRILAGGHSLVPMMKLRLAEPTHLIDINAIEGLRGISEAEGAIVIGAGTLQADILRSELLADKCSILPQAAAQIADPQVRNCGTIGGNCANGDPGNDDPAIMLALDAAYVVRSRNGERVIAARDFYETVYTTALAEDELLTEIRIPIQAAGTGMSYQKIKRKVGDYAIAASAVIVTIEGGRCSSAAIALTNVGDTPLLASDAASALVGSDLGADAVTASAQAAMAICQPAEDLRGNVEYRTAMAGEMTRRAIVEATDRAGGD